MKSLLVVAGLAVSSLAFGDTANYALPSNNSGASIFALTVVVPGSQVTSSPVQCKLETCLIKDNRSFYCFTTNTWETFDKTKSLTWSNDALKYIGNNMLYPEMLVEIKCKAMISNQEKHSHWYYHVKLLEENGNYSSSSPSEVQVTPFAK